MCRLRIKSGNGGDAAVAVQTDGSVEASVVISSMLEASGEVVVNAVMDEFREGTELETLEDNRVLNNVADISESLSRVNTVSGMYLDYYTIRSEMDSLRQEAGTAQSMPTRGARTAVPKGCKYSR